MAVCSIISSRRFLPHDLHMRNTCFIPCTKIWLFTENYRQIYAGYCCMHVCSGLVIDCWVLYFFPSRKKIQLVQTVARLMLPFWRAFGYYRSYCKLAKRPRPRSQWTNQRVEERHVTLLVSRSAVKATGGGEREREETPGTQTRE